MEFIYRQLEDYDNCMQAFHLNAAKLDTTSIVELISTYRSPD